MFLQWATKAWGLDSPLELINDSPMAADADDEFLNTPLDDESQRRIKTEFTRRLLELYPDAAAQVRQAAVEEGIERGIAEGLARGLRQMFAMLFQQRLGRALTDDERAALELRMQSLGAERVGAVVLDHDGDALAAWLRGHDAR